MKQVCSLPDCNRRTSAIQKIKQNKKECLKSLNEKGVREMPRGGSS